jgi:dTDP-glucose 4,6-dehydratase
MKTVLVTGGAGFIGSNFVKHIFQTHKDWNILVVDALTYASNIENIPEEIRNSERFEFWYGDINNLDLMSDLVRRSDMVVHLAAETHVARSLYSQREFVVTDVLGTQSVLNAVLKHAERIERFIHISTSEVYGTAIKEPMDEEHPLNPTTPYAGAKAGADRLVYSYIVSFDLPGLIFRPFNNYGPGQHLEKVIPRFITSCILGEPLTIHGDGSARRDWIFVKDTARAIELALTTPVEKIKGEVINIGTGRSLSVLEIALKILEIFKKDKKNLQFIPDRFGQVQNHISSTEKAMRLLGYNATTGFEEGIRETIEWYLQNRDIWQKQIPLRKVPVRMKDGRVMWY